MAQYDTLRITTTHYHNYHQHYHHHKVAGGKHDAMLEVKMHKRIIIDFTITPMTPHVQNNSRK